MNNNFAAARNRLLAKDFIFCGGWYASFTVDTFPVSSDIPGQVKDSLDIFMTQETSPEQRGLVTSVGVNGLMMDERAYATFVRDYSGRQLDIAFVISPSLISTPTYRTCHDNHHLHFKKPAFSTPRTDSINYDRYPY